MQEHKNFWDKNAGRYDRFMRKDRAAYDEMYEDHHNANKLPFPFHCIKNKPLYIFLSFVFSVELPY